MIPQCKIWNITVLDENNTKRAVHQIWASTKLLARISFRQDYPQHWGYAIKVGLVKKIDNQ